MSNIDRRDFLKMSAGLAAGAATGNVLGAAAPTLHLKPEKGAKLRVLRWKQFVQGDGDLWLANTKKFTEKTGIEVRLDAEGWEDVRPKAAVAANIGSGPDIIISTFEDAHQYPDKRFLRHAGKIGAPYDLLLAEGICEFMKAIADTGLIVAFGNRTDRFHSWAVEITSTVTEPLLTCEAVLAEAAFHLRSVAYVLSLIEDGMLQVSFELPKHQKRLAELAKRYQDRQPDLADLCLIRMSELFPRHP